MTAELPIAEMEEAVADGKTVVGCRRPRRPTNTPFCSRNHLYIATQISTFERASKITNTKYSGLAGKQSINLSIHYKLFKSDRYIPIRIF